MEQYFDIAIKKAQKSSCRYKISAIGFNRKGDMIASVTNQPRFGKEAGGLHAEARLIRENGTKKIRTILICRTNKKGTILPIKPCERCQKLADAHGIKIISVSEDF